MIWYKPDTPPSPNTVYRQGQVLGITTQTARILSLDNQQQQTEDVISLDSLF
jgi:hypothetical protein